MPATNGFQLVPGDLALLQHVHELRLATIDHLATLAGRSYKQTQKRLAKLEERAYLTCLARRPQKHVYAIGREGVPVLIEHVTRRATWQRDAYATMSLRNSAFGMRFYCGHP